MKLYDRNLIEFNDWALAMWIFYSASQEENNPIFCLLKAFKLQLYSSKYTLQDENKRRMSLPTWLELMSFISYRIRVFSQYAN